MSGQQDEAQALLDQGVALYEQGYLYDALRCWKRTLDLDPKNDVAQEYIDFIKGYFNITVEEAIAQCEAAESAAARMEGRTSVSQPPAMPPVAPADNFTVPPPPSPPSIPLQSEVSLTSDIPLEPDAAGSEMPEFSPDLAMQLHSWIGQESPVEDLNEPAIDLGADPGFANPFECPTPPGNEGGDAGGTELSAQEGASGAQRKDGESLEVLESSEHQLGDIDPMALPTSHFSDPKAPEVPQALFDSFSQRPAYERRRMPTGAMAQVNVGGASDGLQNGGYELVFDGDRPKSKADSFGEFKRGLDASSGAKRSPLAAPDPFGSSSKPKTNSRVQPLVVEQSREDRLGVRRSAPPPIPAQSFSSKPPSGVRAAQSFSSKPLSGVRAESGFAGGSPSGMHASPSYRARAVPPPIPAQVSAQKPLSGVGPSQSFNQSPSSSVRVQASSSQNLTASVLGNQPTSVQPPSFEAQASDFDQRPSSNGSRSRVDQRLPMNERSGQPDLSGVGPSASVSAARSQQSTSSGVRLHTDSLMGPPPADVDWSATGFLSSDPGAPKPTLTPDVMGITDDMAGFENEFGMLLESVHQDPPQGTGRQALEDQVILAEDLNGFDPWKEGEDLWGDGGNGGSAPQGNKSPTAQEKPTFMQATSDPPGAMDDQADFFGGASMPSMPSPSAPPNDSPRMATGRRAMSSDPMPAMPNPSNSPLDGYSSASQAPVQPQVMLPLISDTHMPAIHFPPQPTPNPFSGVAERIKSQTNLKTLPPEPKQPPKMSDLDAFLQGELAGFDDLGSAPAPQQTPIPRIQTNLSRSDCLQMSEQAEQCMKVGDLQGAYLKYDEVQAADPENETVRRFMMQNEVRLKSLFLTMLGSLQKVPRLNIAKNEIIWQSLDHKAGFLLSQIDGLTSYEDLITISCMPEFDAMRILVRFLNRNMIR